MPQVMNSESMRDLDAAASSGLVRIARLLDEGQELLAAVLALNAQTRHEQALASLIAAIEEDGNLDLESLASKADVLATVARNLEEMAEDIERKKAADSRQGSLDDDIPF